LDLEIFSEFIFVIRLLQKFWEHKKLDLEFFVYIENINESRARL
jgi:hypothetical protein